LLINGHRLKPPHERPQQASDALRVAAETMRYGIAPTSALFEAVRAHISGDEDSVAAFTRAIFTTDGLVNFNASA
jgi:hypothetical protein